MAESTQEVKARLSIETEGEPAAFQEAAAGVKALAADSAGATAPLGSLTGQLNALAASVRSMGPAGEAFGRVSEAIDRFGKAKGIGDQKKAIEDALRAWKEFGREIPDILAKGGRSAKEFEEGLALLEAQAARFAEPFVRSVDQARAAVEDLQESIEGSMEGADGKLVQARRRIDEYKSALEAAKEAGQGVTSDQTSELERLEQEYEQATQAVAKFGKTKEEVKKKVDAAKASMDQGVGSINSLGDIAEKASPKLGKLIGVATAYVGAFTAGYAAGEKLRAILNSLSDGAFDRFIQKGLRMEAVANQIADGLAGIGREAETLANQRSIFEKLGFEGFSKDVEANERIIERHTRAVHEDKSKIEEFAKSLGLSREELDKQAAVLSENIELFRKSNPQIDAKAYTDIVNGPIQALLDGYAKLGIEVPKHLKAVADASGVLSTKAEADVKKHEEAVKRHGEAVKAVLQSITGVVSRTSAELRAQASVVSDAVAVINKAKLSPEGLNRARDEVQALVNAFHAAGEQIPATLLAAADKVGVFVAAMERGNVSVTPFAGAVDGAATSLVKLERAADGTYRVVDRLGESTVKTSGEIAASTTVISDMNPVIDQAQISLADLKAKYGEAGRAAQDAGDKVQGSSKRVGDGARALANAGVDAKASGDALRGAGESAAGAAPPLEQAGAAAGKLAAGSKEAATGLSGLARGAGAAKTPVDALLTSVKSLQDALDGLGSKPSFAGPIVAELQSIINKAHEAKQALDAVAAGEAGG